MLIETRFDLDGETIINYFETDFLHKTFEYDQKMPIDFYCFPSFEANSNSSDRIVWMHRLLCAFAIHDIVTHY